MVTEAVVAKFYKEQREQEALAQHEKQREEFKQDQGLQARFDAATAANR